MDLFQGRKDSASLGEISIDIKQLNSQCIEDLSQQLTSEQKKFLLRALVFKSEYEIGLYSDFDESILLCATPLAGGVSLMSLVGGLLNNSSLFTAAGGIGLPISCLAGLYVLVKNEQKNLRKNEHYVQLLNEGQAAGIHTLIPDVIKVTRAILNIGYSGEEQCARDCSNCQDIQKKCSQCWDLGKNGKEVYCNDLCEYCKKRCSKCVLCERRLYHQRGDYIKTQLTEGSTSFPTNFDKFNTILIDLLEKQTKKIN